MNPDSTSDIVVILLTQEQEAIVDMIDSDLAQLKWQAHKAPDYANSSYSYTANRTAYVNGKQVLYYMHRVILERMIGRTLNRLELVDHIDNNPLNNRRENLRLANHSENAMNKGRHKNNKSGFKGVSWHKKQKKWIAAINYNGEREHLGSFNTPEEAYKVYCEAALRHHGKYARQQ